MYNKYWKCIKCLQETNELQICWGMCGGQKIDVLDYFCPNCGHDILTFQGSKEEKEIWWDKEWEK